MAHLQYMPGDPRLVDQLVYELKSKGIFDQFRKECIADVDTRPAYQNLRQRVENSVSTFLSRQCWKPDLNKNQLREKLRKHILDGNYLEQGVERIVDQVVNPKVASVFIPQVEDLVYNYLGISRKKSVATAETSNGKVDNDLLPTDLEAVSPGSVKSNDDKDETMDTSEIKEDSKMEVDEEEKPKDEIKEESLTALEVVEKEKIENQDTQLSGISDLTSHDSDVSMDKSNIPLPAEEIKLENIPQPENSPPKVELEKIELPREPNLSTDIPLPDEIPKEEKEHYFKPINSDDDDSSSDSSLRRNMSPLTPIRNFNNENSCDAQQGFENDSGDSKSDDKKEPSSFRFAIESKSPENSADAVKTENKEKEQSNLAYQFNNQVNLNAFNTPAYEDSSNSNNLRIDYESDANSKTTDVKVPETDQNSNDSKREQKSEEKKSSSKSSHRSRDSHRHSSSSKDRRSDSKHSSSRDRKESKYDKKSSKDDNSKSKSSHRERSRDRSEKKDSRDSSKHRSSTHKSSGHKDSKSHRSSSSSQRHSSKHSDEKKSSSSYHKDKTDKSSDKSSKEYKSSKDSKSHRSDKDKKSSSKSKHDDKDKEKKEKKETDDHYSLSGRGNNNRRSTDRDSNDGSSSSKGSNNQSSSKSLESKKDNKETSSKSDNTSTSNDSTGPSESTEQIVNETDSDSKDVLQPKPIVRVETHLETPISTPPRLPFVPEVTLKKPKFAANLEEAKKLMKMRKFLDEEQKRMNQEAALLLEFQANVRPSLSQVYSSIPGPELEFACVTTTLEPAEQVESNQGVIDSILQEVATNEVEEYPTEVINETNNDSGNVETNNEIKNETYEENKEVINCETDFETVQREEENRKRTEYFEVTIITEEVSENEENEYSENEIYEEILQKYPDEHPLKYFAEHEKYSAEVERDNFSKFFKSFNEKASMNNKLYLINCDTYEENIIREVSENFGPFEIINYYKNGYLKLPKVAKHINLATEITLPIDKTKTDYDLTCVKSSCNSPVFSPVKSECSFELSSDYDAKLEEMVNKTSRQEIMEIILGGAMTEESPNKMPKIDYCVESNIDDIVENVKYSLKRKLDEVESTDNNNRQVLTPKKMRKLSGSDQISSTTEESDERSDRSLNTTRSKYFGKVRRVGLPRPRKSSLPNSPSSDKSVENYEQNTQVTHTPTPNGKMKSTSPRSKVQRYDTSDLYKPKLHYLSRRNNIS